jgi:hypothetical protein
VRNAQGFEFLADRDTDIDLSRTLDSSDQSNIALVSLRPDRPEVLGAEV